MNLSIEQERPLLSGQPHRKVIAGAGSGKTRVLVAQVERWLDEGADPGEISVVTFTRRAAMEVRRRLPEEAQAKLGHVGTIGGFAFRRLFEAGIRYTIVDDFDLSLIINYVAEEAKRTTKKTARRTAPECRPDVVARLVLNAEYGKETATDKAIAALVLAYLKQHRLMHVSGVLARFLRFLEESDKGGASWRATRRLAWDEFQDSSDLELRLLRTLDPKESLIIGDPRQSIYQWRGAVPENIDRAQGVTFGLSDNYRSATEIVNYCNALPAAQGFREQEAIREDRGQAIAVASEDHVFADSFYPWLVRTYGPATVLCRTNREIQSLYDVLSTTALRVSVVATAFDKYTTWPWRALYVAARLVLDPGNQRLEAATRFSPGKWRAGSDIALLSSFIRGTDERADDPQLTGSIVEWLEWYNFRDVQDQIPSDDKAPDILLMTVHGAKGLEWSTVVIHNHGRFARARKPEEANVLYVAASRARDRLFFFDGDEG